MKYALSARNQLEGTVTKVDKGAVNGIVVIDDPAKDIDQFGDVIGMKTGGRFIKDIDGLASRSLLEFESEFDTLGLTATKCRGRLT